MSEQKSEAEKYKPQVNTNHALSGRSSPGLLIVFVVLLVSLVIYSML